VSHYFTHSGEARNRVLPQHRRHLITEKRAGCARAVRDGNVVA
jgi:hypothetical protein